MTLSKAPFAGLGSIIVAVAGLATAPALAQNALGDGRALDANPGLSGSTNAPVRDLQAEIAFRNAIVTGNAANFQSFRGDVGYGAAGEFRGFLGSDELFAFRRDSLISGLAGIGIRGTSALQYQFALSTGSTPPDGLVGGFTVAREGFTVQAPGATTNPAISRFDGFDSSPGEIQGLRRAAPVPEVDDRGTLLGTLRSPAAFASNRGLSQVYLGSFSDIQQDALALTASELRAVRTISLAVQPGRGRSAEAENAGIPDDEDTPDPNDRRTDTQRDTQLDSSARTADPRDTQRPAAVPGTMHERILRDVVGLDEEQSAQLDQNSPRVRIQRLRQALVAPELFDLTLSPEGDDTPDAPDPSASPDDGPQTPPTVPTSPQGQPGDQAEDPNTVSDREQTLRDNIAGTDTIFLDALGNADRVRELIDQDRAERTAYGQHILAGERLLARGRYFDAEERFAHALSLVRGDVTAQVGRVHAQIGAGLFVSAAVNLRGLFTEHPELILTRYEADLLPVADRLATVTAELERIMQEQPSTRLGLASALLVAYLAYQRDDLDAVAVAFGVIEGDATESVLGITDARLAILLRRLWLPESNDKTQPGDAQGSGAQPTQTEPGG